MVDLQEEHADKYSRLFYKVTGNTILAERELKDDKFKHNIEQTKSKTGGRVQFDV